MRITRGRQAGLLVALVALMAMAFTSTASASHFRYVSTSWAKAGAPADGNQAVNFNFRQGWRWSAFSNPAVGSLVNLEGHQFGDGQDIYPQFRVEFVNAAEDYFTAVAVNPADTSSVLIPHTYSLASNPFTARMNSGCCIISTTQNARDQNYADGNSLVDLAKDDESPVSTVPPVVNLPEGGVQTFKVPAIDNGGETLRWRLTNGDEACDCADPNPPGLSIDPTTGTVSWDTTGRDGLWYSGAVIEAVNASNEVVSSTQVNYIIRVSEDSASNAAPTWDAPTPDDGTIYDLTPGQSLSLTLKAIDPDAGDTVQILKNSGPGTFTPADGNPATGSYAFTADASQVGQSFIVQFIAQDNGNPPLGPAPRSITIRVIEEEEPPPAGEGSVLGRATVYGGLNNFSNNVGLIVDYVGKGDSSRNRKTFDVPCDATKPVDLEVRWGFHASNPRGTFTATSLKSSLCTDDPKANPGSPAAGHDTVVIEAEGTYNGKAGAKAVVLLQDRGEPGVRADRAALELYDADGKLVVSQTNRFVGAGNIDAVGGNLPE